MNRKTFASICLALCGATLSSVSGIAAQAPAAPAPAAQRPPGAQGPAATQRPMVSCTRGGLQFTINQYLAAQAKGDVAGLPLATGLGYWEQMKPADIKTGFLTKPLQISRTMSIIDQDSCQTYTEIMVGNAADPYVAGIRMRVNHDKIAEIEVIYETTGYWLFNVDGYMKYAALEDWSPIEPLKRDSRGTLVRAANAYLDAFLEAKIDAVPWGFPCVRIEGGMYTGRGRPDDSCEAGVPAGVNIANRRFIVDEVMGTVVALCTFGAGGPGGGSGAPDAHMFRLENGKLRYVHTLTALLQNRTLPAPPAASAPKP